MSRGAYKNDPIKRKARAAWRNMKSRCYNPNNSMYKRYGGRGIKLCDEWLYSFLPFYKWSLKNGIALGLSIDRVDNDGDYSPDNCRWVDCKTQSNNTSSNRVLEYNGERMTVQQWADKIGITHQALSDRLSSGLWDLGEALTHKANERKVKIPSARKRIVQMDGEEKVVREWGSISEAASATGIPTSNISRCLKYPQYTSRGYKWRYANIQN